MMASDSTVALSLSVRNVLVLAFVVGIVTGGFFSLMALQVAGATGFIVADSNTGDNQPSPSDTGDSPSEDRIDPSEISLDGRPSLGEEDAPVTVVEFADYQCPFCRKFALETFDQIKEDYIDTGKVRFVYKDLPLVQLGHDQAIPMAKAAHCAGEQDQYWAMHDKLYDEQRKISPRETAKFGGDEIPIWANELGLNMNEFNQCMQSDRYDAQIQEDLSEAQAVGASGTPTFFINGKRVVGAQPYQAFKQVIESELNNQ